MRASSPNTGRWGGRLPQVGSLLVITALVFGCSAATAPSETTSASPTPIATATATATAPSSPPASPTSTTEPPTGLDEWRLAGQTAAERETIAAALLGDGRVLVIGDDRMIYDADGDDIPILQDTVELWDPATDVWSVTASLPKRRFEPALVSLQDGRALVIGGHNVTSQSFSSAYAFDPRSDTWSKVGLMGTARSAPAAAVLDDGRVLVAGGYYRVPPNFDYGDRAGPAGRLVAYRPGGASGMGDSDRRFYDIDPPNVGYAFATAEIYDPRTDTWSPTGSMRFARYGAAAVTLADGRVLIVGSGDVDGHVKVDDRAFETAEVYDPGTGRFIGTADLPEIDRDAVRDAGVVLPAGDPEPAAVGRLAALDDGGALLVGHAGWWKHQGDIIRTLRFDAAEGTWEEAAPAYAWAFNDGHDQSSSTAGEGRLGAAVAVLPTGRTLVAGGQGSKGERSVTGDSAAAFRAAQGDWTDLPVMPIARVDGAAVSLQDGSVLVVGGYRDTESDFILIRDAVRFVPAT